MPSNPKETLKGAEADSHGGTGLRSRDLFISSIVLDMALTSAGWVGRGLKRPSLGYVSIFSNKTAKARAEGP